MTDCGPGGGGTESCCTSLEVTGGTYDRTYTYGVAGGSDPATVSGFRLDKYLVTVGRFRQFMTAWNGGAGFLPTAGSGKHTHLNQGSGLANVGAGGGYEQGWSATWNGTAYVDPTPARLVCGLGTSLAYTWTPTAGSQESLPINCVTWYEAYAFCIWDGGFLPSEAEWEYAAAGGAEQREYPWGATDPGTSSQYAIYGCHYGPSSCPGLANTAPVGTPALGATLCGQLDMGGNQWEWTLDWYATYVDPCTDCAYLTATSGNQVIRGGSWHAGAADLAPPFRAVENPPTARNNNNGFRCARAP
jgi:formylglycine-generating enzyme required for sulfatase activity